MTTIIVDGTPIAIQEGSLNITDQIEQRSTASFVIRDDTAASHYKKGQPVVITDDDGNPIYGGVINTPKEQTMTGASFGGLWHSIDCADYHYYSDKRLAAVTYNSTAAGDIVQDLITKYLADEGIVAGVIESGPIINTAAINYAYVSDAIDQLATQANFTWYITADKKLHFHSRGAVRAPFDGDETYAMAGTVTVQRGNDQYRNRQYIRGGFQITDPQTANRTGDGETTTWTMDYDLAAEPTITVNGNAQIVGIKGVDTGKEFYWNSGDNTISQDSSATPLAKGDALEITYQGQYPIIVLSEDQGGIQDRIQVEGGGSGYWDDIEDDPNVSDSSAAFQEANSYLEKYGVIGATVSYRTMQSGLVSGQLQTVNFPIHGINSVDMLIQQVTITESGNTIYYDVTVVEGPVISDWSKALATGLTRPTVYIDQLNVGEQSTVVVYAPETEAWTWSENPVMSVFACPVPADTLYPSDTLYPC